MSPSSFGIALALAAALTVWRSIQITRTASRVTPTQKAKPKLKKRPDSTLFGQ